MADLKSELNTLPYYQLTCDLWRLFKTFTEHKPPAGDEEQKQLWCDKLVDASGDLVRKYEHINPCVSLVVSQWVRLTEETVRKRQ